MGQIQQSEIDKQRKLDSFSRSLQSSQDRDIDLSTGEVRRGLFSDSVDSDFSEMNSELDDARFAMEQKSQELADRDLLRATFGVADPDGPLFYRGDDGAPHVAGTYVGTDKPAVPSGLGIPDGLGEFDYFDANGRILPSGMTRDNEASYYAGRFGSGLVAGVTEPFLIAADLARAGYGLAAGNPDLQMWSGLGRAAENGAGIGELLPRAILGSNPITGVGVFSYDATTAALNGDWGGLAESAGGLLSGAAFGGALGKYGNYNMRSPFVVGRGTLGSMGIEGFQSPLVAPRSLVNNGFFEILAEAPISGNGRPAHRASANGYFAEQLRLDPSYSAGMDGMLGADVLGSMQRGGGALRNPPGTEWHHPLGNKDVMWLLREQVHRSPELQDYLHKNGSGGFAEHYGKKDK